MSRRPRNKNRNNTTLDDGRTLISTLTGSKSPYNKTINDYLHFSEQLLATTSSTPNQFNSDNPLQKRSSDNVSMYRSRDKSTQEQKICYSCEGMKSTLSKVEESLKHLNYEVEQICEFIDRESRSEKLWYYRGYKYLSQNFTSNNTEDSICTKLLEISEFIKTILKSFNEQRNLIVQKDEDIGRFQKEIEGLKTNLISLKLSKDTAIDELNKQILGLKETHAKEIVSRDNSFVFWQDKFDIKFKLCKDLGKNMIEQNEIFNKSVTSMQGKIDEKDRDFNKQHNLMVQKDQDIKRFQKEIVELKNNLSSLKLSKDTTIVELNKKILDLKERHAKEIDNRDNSLVFWQDKFDMKFKQCKDLEKNMIELNETFNKNVTSMQGKIDEKDMQLKNYSRNLDITSNNLRHETAHRERLQREFKRIQKLVVVKENALGREKEKFRESLSAKIKLLADYSDAISLEDVALQAENQFVLQTMEINNKIKDETAKYEEEVDNFSNSRREKLYLHIREMLVRILEKLDAVESQNNEKIQTTINRKIP